MYPSVPPNRLGAQAEQSLPTDHAFAQDNPPADRFDASCVIASRQDHQGRINKVINAYTCEITAHAAEPASPRFKPPLLRVEGRELRTNKHDALDGFAGGVPGVSLHRVLDQSALV